ncbi:hypothetical protein FRC07_009601, partial [Ceratobasidium sp. 392]
MFKLGKFFSLITGQRPRETTAPTPHDNPDSKLQNTSSQPIDGWVSPDLSSMFKAKPDPPMNAFRAQSSRRSLPNTTPSHATPIAPTIPDIPKIPHAVSGPDTTSTSASPGPTAHLPLSFSMANRYNRDTQDNRQTSTSLEFLHVAPFTPPGAPKGSGVSALPSTSYTHKVSLYHGDHHDDEIVEAMLGTKRSPKSAPVPIQVPSNNASTPSDNPRLIISPHAALGHTSPSVPKNSDTGEDDLYVSDSDTVTQDNFYEAQDKLYAARNRSYASQDGFYTALRERRAAIGSSHMAQTNVYRPQTRVYTPQSTLDDKTPNKSGTTMPAGNPGTSLAPIDERDEDSEKTWEGGLTGESQLEGTSDSKLAKWTFLEDGIADVLVAGRMEGDIHFSPSRQPSGSREALLSW